jgi:hypothetical protein
MNEIYANAACLEREIAWFDQVLSTRFNSYFEREGGAVDVRDHQPPDLSQDQSQYARVVRECAMNFDERIVLILTAIPHVRPQALDPFFTHNKAIDRGFTEFGGWRGKAHGGLMPTCETAAFILAGSDLPRRFEVIGLFEETHFFTTRGIIKVQNQVSGEPLFAGALILANEYLNRFTTGHYHKPDYSADFPAKLITSKLSWGDLVLGAEVMDEIENINAWLRHADTIVRQWGLEKSVKPGYRSLFYGPPGTGKTLTATLIGATAGVDVYRIDLSMVVSKYIGETEKNLANVFDQAQNRNWILFFDEADALFGKRTQASSSNDRHANQEISYLLQRVEDFPGVVILATNLKANIDEAFARRFQTTVYFPIPDARQRLRLWQGLFPDTSILAADVALEKLAEKYELSGGALTNVARYAAIRATRMNRSAITQDDLVKGIGKELLKEGRTL